MWRRDFSFHLPDALIARNPLPERSASRLLRLDPMTGAIAHGPFTALLDQLHPGDLLVFNQSRVMPARLHARKETGGVAEILIERLIAPDRALAQVRASKSPKPGSRLLLADGTAVVMTARSGDLFELQVSVPWAGLMASFGEMPLPPYLGRGEVASDRERYQTVYARDEGSVAAPTAGLHFDEPLLAALALRGVNLAFVTLHVGAGTYQPVRAESIQDHVMHAEWMTVSAEVVAAIQATKAAGHRVVAVGTTSVRALESAAWAAQGVDPDAWRLTEHLPQGSGQAVQQLKPFAGDTRMFITPGYHWQVVDGLVTNFHLPESTLLMLVSALAGREHILAAYEAAIAERYRFFSYGDAMLILPGAAA